MGAFQGRGSSGSKSKHEAPAAWQVDAASFERAHYAENIQDEGQEVEKVVEGKEDPCREAENNLTKCHEKAVRHLAIHPGKQTAQVKKSAVWSSGLGSCPTSVPPAARC